MKIECLQIFFGRNVPWQYVFRILKFLIGRLVCGKLIQKLTLPMEMSILKNAFFTNLITDLDSPQKSVYRNCSTFFNIQTGSGLKM